MKNTLIEEARLNFPSRNIKAVMGFDSVARQRDHLSLRPPPGQARQGRPAHQLSLIPVRRRLSSPPQHPGS